MNTTTPAQGAGVAVSTVASDLTAQRTAISIDWTCLTLLQPDDRCIDAATVYAELGLHVIPDPVLPDSSPLPDRRAVLLHWQQTPLSRVGLLSGTRFDALAATTDQRGRQNLQALAAHGLLDGCFAQIERQDDTLLLFAPTGLSSRSIGFASHGVRVIGRSDRIDVTPRSATWLFVEPGRYGRAIPVEQVEAVLS